MKTTLYSSDQLNDIAQVIKQGKMIAIATDTVYGLAIDSTNFSAIENMKIAKGRPEEKPFPMMICSIEQLESVAVVSDDHRKVVASFMPGALTIVFKKQDSLSDVVTNGFSTVGIRMPDDDWVLDLITLVGNPLLVPSANISGAPSCTTSAEVLEQLDGLIDGVVVGQSGAKQSSTVVDMSESTIKILREGIIKLEDILEVLK